jgi:hypothetical protein
MWAKFFELLKIVAKYGQKAVTWCWNNRGLIWSWLERGLGIYTIADLVRQAVGG